MAARPPATPNPAVDDLLVVPTKLLPPSGRPGLIARPSLVHDLSRGLRGPLTLVAAPPGFGKTSLVAAWRSSPEGARWPLGWLSLEADDDESARFGRYLVASLRAGLDSPDVGTRVLAGLSAGCHCAAPPIHRKPSPD